MDTIIILDMKRAKNMPYIAEKKAPWILMKRSSSMQTNFPKVMTTVGRTMYSLYFKNLVTQKTLNYAIHNIESNIAWANDNKTIYYTSQNDTTLNPEKVYRHVLGSDNKQDKLVYHEKDGDYWSGVYRSKSGEFIIIYSEGHLSSEYQILS